MKKIFAIMGATGHVGRIVAEELLKRGHTVRAIGRDQKKLHQLEIKGAIPIVADFTDSETLTNAFKDAFAVFSFMPPGNAEEHFIDYENRVSEAIYKAIRDSKVMRVVNLSSMGAHLSKGNGPIANLYRHEQKLNGIKNLKTLVHLRPTYFMENLIAYLPMMESEGIISSPIKENLLIPMVAARDIGWKAADFLDSTQDMPQLVFEFVGPQAVTMKDVAQCFAEAFDMPYLTYMEVLPKQEKKRMIDQGVPPEFVEAIIELDQAFNLGLIEPTQDLKASHHGTTTLKEFAYMLAHRVFAQTRP